MLWHDGDAGEGPDWVEEGSPVGQFYGLGGVWTTWNDLSEITENLGEDTPARAVRLPSRCGPYMAAGGERGVACALSAGWNLGPLGAAGGGHVSLISSSLAVGRWTARFTKKSGSMDLETAGSGAGRVRVLDTVPVGAMIFV